MASKFEMLAEPRHDVGKGASRRLRLTDKIPAVVYGGGKSAAALSLDHNSTYRTLGIEAVYSHILSLKVGSESERVILKDLQRHPYKPRILHIDFQRIRADEKLHMHVPLHFTGGENPPGVKEGGTVSHLMNDVEISCFPDDLPEFIAVDISEMQLNQILHLSDIKLPKGVEIPALTHGRDTPIVSIHVPRVVEEEVIPTEAPVAAAEVPTIVQKGEEEGGEEAAGKEGKGGKEKGKGKE